jgi:hypothetical protein
MAFFPQNWKGRRLPHLFILLNGQGSSDALDSPHQSGSSSLQLRELSTFCLYAKGSAVAPINLLSGLEQVACSISIAKGPSVTCWVLSVPKPIGSCRGGFRHCGLGCFKPGLWERLMGSEKRNLFLTRSAVWSV